MSPMSWLTLMFYFISVIMIITTINYFNLNPLMKKEIVNSTKFFKNWKW